MIAFSLGGFHVYRYGIFYLVTCLLGYRFLWRVGSTKVFARYTGLQKVLTDGLDDLVIAIIAGVIIGGRLGHVFIYDRAYYSTHLSEIIKLRQGGMSFIGGMFGVIIAIFALQRHYRLSRSELFLLFDLILLIVPIGIFLGRIGNFLNQELYGIIVPTTLSRLNGTRATHIYDHIDTHRRFNTNFMAAIGEGLISLVVLATLAGKQAIQKHWQPGLLSVTFVMIYSVVRFFLEFLRQDSQIEYVGWFTTTQWFMIGFVVVGFTLWGSMKKSLDITPL